MSIELKVEDGKLIVRLMEIDSDGGEWIVAESSIPLSALVEVA